MIGNRKLKPSPRKPTWVKNQKKTLKVQQNTTVSTTRGKKSKEKKKKKKKKKEKERKQPAKELRSKNNLGSRAQIKLKQKNIAGLTMESSRILSPKGKEKK